MTEVTRESPIERAGEKAGEGTISVTDPNLQWALAHVLDSLRNLQFGVVTLTIQDGVVIQVERTDRRRYQRRAASGRGAGGSPASG
jgi:hypothetical protein